MKRHIGYILTALVVVSCGTPSDRFRVEGRFRSFNQGEFYVYRLDYDNTKIDTIRVADGRFAYDIALEDTITMSLMFPNYSEIPLFAEPGVKVKVEGDASHLKEVEITGTETNELMTRFRMQTGQMTPPEAVEAAQKFIEEHLQSPISVYLINKYFVQKETPDYQTAYRLTTHLLEAQPNNVALQRLKKRLEPMRAFTTSGKLPSFDAVDLNGRRVSQADLNADVNVVAAWASWSYESQNIQRMLIRMKKEHPRGLAVVTVCIDANKKDCQGFVDRDSVKLTTVCDGRMWESPVMRRLGMATIPANVVTDRSGKIVGRNMSADELKKHIESILK